MEATESRAVTATGSRSGTAAFVAATGFHPEHECVVGELVWTSDLCDDLPCQCQWGFNGIASDGIATVAEIRVLAGVDRASVRRALVARMIPAGYPLPIARARVDALLDLAGRFPEGTLFRLEHGRPVAFPRGARVSGPQEVVFPAPEARR